MTELRTLALRTVMASFDGGSLPGWARRRLAGMGGICLFGENVPSLDTVRDLCAAIHDAAPDAIVSLDEEGGDVTRLYYAVGSPHAGHAALGVVDDIALTRAVARDIGAELRDIGVDLDLGPVADVNSNPLNPVIGVRSFGGEPDLAARHVAAFVEGLQAAGVGACLKHFPGHGDTVADSHVALPVAEAPLEVLRTRELVPFPGGRRGGRRRRDDLSRGRPSPGPGSAGDVQCGGDEVAAHARGRGRTRLPGPPGERRPRHAGRQQCDIGVPAAAVQALTAGVDLLCLGPNFTEDQVEAVVDGIVTAVRSGAVAEDRLTEAAERVAVTAARLRSLQAAATAGGSADESASVSAARSAVTVDGHLTSLTGAQVLRFVSGANVAAGHVPWGCRSRGGCSPGHRPSTSSRAARCPTWTRTDPSSRWSAGGIGMRGCSPGSPRSRAADRTWWSWSWLARSRPAPRPHRGPHLRGIRGLGSSSRRPTRRRGSGRMTAR